MRELLLGHLPNQLHLAAVRAQARAAIGREVCARYADASPLLRSNAVAATPSAIYQPAVATRRDPASACRLPPLPPPPPATHVLVFGASLSLQVRARAEELKRSLEAIIQGLQFAADRVQWCAVPLLYFQPRDAGRPHLLLARTPPPMLHHSTSAVRCLQVRRAGPVCHHQCAVPALDRRAAPHAAPICRIPLFGKPGRCSLLVGPDRTA